MSKCGDGIFKKSVEDAWMWGEHKLPKVSVYTYVYLGIGNEALDVHLKTVIKGKSVA